MMYVIKNGSIPSQEERELSSSWDHLQRDIFAIIENHSDRMEVYDFDVISEKSSSFFHENHQNHGRKFESWFKKHLLDNIGASPQFNDVIKQTVYSHLTDEVAYYALRHASFAKDDQGKLSEGYINALSSIDRATRSGIKMDEVCTSIMEFQEEIFQASKRTDFKTRIIATELIHRILPIDKFHAMMTISNNTMSLPNSKKSVTMLYPREICKGISAYQRLSHSDRESVLKSLSYAVKSYHHDMISGRIHDDLDEFRNNGDEDEFFQDIAYISNHISHGCSNKDLIITAAASACVDHDRFGLIIESML